MVDRKSFLQSGHKGSLLSAFLYFDVSFMLWVLLGPLAVLIANDYGLNAAQKANLVALPALGGSVLRLVLGYLTDRIGAKKTGILGMLLTVVPLLYGWKLASSLNDMYFVALMLGIAGASFAAALPLASRWYPPQYQGLALGIAGAGNSGTIFSTLFANRLAQHYGDWHLVFGLALIPLAVVFLIFLFTAKDSPTQPAPLKLADYGRVLRQKDTWLFCFFYMVTFGGFSGMANYLTIFFNTEYKLSAVTAADFATICIIAGSLFRPIGGYLSDRMGGIKMLMLLYGVIGVMLAAVSMLPALWLTTALLFVAMMGMGMGNGAVFQLVPQRFSHEVGIITGIVGAAGGLGGFFLPKILGTLKLTTGSFTPGFLVLSVIALSCIVVIAAVQGKWKRTWVGEGGKVQATGALDSVGTV
ncbi:MFS transporter, NNP family, nitrate/nitrite transporter [Paenibacillus sp. UNCCL117]|uniref:nitrate/nitrite transporter n=1 Tax=unclassified Paenibacillus TaxID=185978 RepID=UPI0008894DE0|nr:MULTISPECIES: nitrate/nitrite transporter [unclassified Paenibacillus]SDD23932.1 MFS transporter, NNP family, nitrate/nitrite transporter [Paenibacillus sp. cl123]SFW41583.1 MFS transporter, NNP family, nitrate/nitrite transporter [Paenibacillus sp. UNCCL117]